MASYLDINQWNGGLSDGSRLGIDGSFRFGQGLDYKTNIDAITANLALVKDSSTTVTGLVKWMVHSAAQDDVYAYDDAGNIYKKDTTTWSNIRTVASSQGQGLEIYNDYLFYAQNSQIGRYGTLSGTPSFTDNWQTSLNGTTALRPLKAFQNLLCVGNGRYLATWDGSTWTAQKLTFPPNWYVSALDVRGDYLAIAVNNASTVAAATRGIIFYWDGLSSTYNFFTEVMEGGGISAIQANQESVWIFPGNAGNIYLDTGRVTKVKRIPFIEEGKTVYVRPGATANFRGVLVFGLADGTSTTAYRGVYEYGSSDKNYSSSLNFGYPISTNTVQGTGVAIGSILTVGSQIYVGWKDGSAYGIDLLSTSTLQASVTYESRVLSLPKQAAIQRVKVFFEPLASGESITVKYKADRESSWHTYGNAISFSADGAITTKTINDEFRATEAEFQLVLAGSPTIHKVLVEYQMEARI